MSHPILVKVDVSSRLAVQLDDGQGPEQLIPVVVAHVLGGATAVSECPAKVQGQAESAAEVVCLTPEVGVG